MKSILQLVGLISLTLAMQTYANDNTNDNVRACTIDGKFELFGQTIESKDCLEMNDPKAIDKLKSYCGELASASEKMGGTAGTVTYSATCPKPAQGACLNVGGKAINTFYYKRSADDLAALPQSCAMIGGTWQPAG